MLALEFLSGLYCFLSRSITYFFIIFFFLLIIIKNCQQKRQLLFVTVQKRSNVNSSDSNTCHTPKNPSCHKELSLWCSMGKEMNTQAGKQMKSVVNNISVQLKNEHCFIMHFWKKCLLKHAKAYKITGFTKKTDCWTSWKLFFIVQWVVLVFTAEFSVSLFPV